MECFTVYADNLKGILSPLFFISQPENTKGFIELNKIAEINPSRKINNLDLNDLVPYVGLPETDNLEIKEVLKRPYKEVKGRNIIKKGDILFARIEPSIFNKKYILADDLQGNDYAFTSTEFYIVKAKENINPKFLFYMFFTKEVYVQVLGRTTGSTGRRRLDRGVFENLLIPFPDKQIQNKIVQLIDKVYSQKKQKESEAQKLLDSLNDYVLGELGIKLPELKERLTYTVFSEETKSGRLDPRYYKPFFKEFEEELNKRRDLKSLGEISEYIGSGATPRAGGEDYTSIEEGVPFIRIVNLKNNTIILSDTLYIKKSIHEGMLKRTQLKPNDVLLSMAGTIGLSVVVPATIKEANINQAIARIVLKRGIEPVYISAILNSKIGVIQTDRLSRPSVQANINLEEIGTLKIPIPKPEIQKKIIEEVKKRMQKAEQLQKEAKEELEKAKQEVEKIILGDN